MKHKYIFVAALLVVLTIGSYIISVTGTKIEKKEDELLVVTSFYPVYIATLNVTDGVEDVQVQCLTRSTTGCVHDIQLTTQDMRLLEQADLFIINGAGMESYLDSIKERYPDLQIVDTSQGVQLLEASGEHHHEEDADAHEEEKHEEDAHEEEAHEEDVHVEEAHAEESHETEASHNHVHNSHIWMDMDNYCIQVENISEALMELDKANQTKYEENSHEYQHKIKELQEEGKGLAGETHVDAISTHEAFSYFANNLNWHMTATINMDENTSLQAAELGEIIELVQTNEIPYIFTEAIYGTELSNVLKNETGCKTVVLDTLVTGEEDKDAYLKGMSKNLQTLREVTGP